MNNTRINAHPGISIALCTFNGEKFLKEQLDSFVQQTLPPYELVVCDDCSSDSTCEILEEFSQSAPFPVRIFRNEYNLGLIKNFSKAASLCQGEYLAFSDQDDIWLPDRLDACYRIIKKAELEYGTGIPLMVHSDLSLIDTDNHVIAPSCMKVRNVRHVYIDPLRTILIQNYISGCTSLCNRHLIEESLPFPDVVTNHDGWCALIAASHGKILFIPEPKVLYRQHAYNVTGRASYFHSMKYLKPGNILKGLIPWSVYMVPKMFYQAKLLQKRLIDLSCEVPPYLGSYIDALEKGGIMNALKVMFSLKIRRQGFVSNVFDFYVMARGIHLRYVKNHDDC